jgi:hypothetical protein
VKLEDIQAAWKSDSAIDRTELGEESLKIPQLHSKYFNLFSQERLTYKKMESDYKRLLRLKHEYYTGVISEEDLREHQWDPFQLKILRTDLSLYLESDTDLQTLQLKLEMQKEKVDFLDSAIKSLSVRGYQIKNAIDWTKFQMGG